MSTQAVPSSLTTQAFKLSLYTDFGHISMECDLFFCISLAYITIGIYICDVVQTVLILQHNNTMIVQGAHKMR